MDIFEKIRWSAKFITSRAQFVKMDLKRLRELSDDLDVKAIKDFYKYEGDFYFMGKNEELLNYVITLNAMNFGSGLSASWDKHRQYKESSFKSVASALKSFIDKGKRLDPEFAKKVSQREIAEIIGIDTDSELVKMFRISLNQLGTCIYPKFKTYSHFLNSFNAKNRARDLVLFLMTNLSCYKDVSSYEGKKVYFLKRAQILVNDLYLAFEGKKYGKFDDVNGLTMFADNLLPHFFRVERALEYSPELLSRIDKGEEIVKDSQEEVEIRAFAIECVENIKSYLNGKGANLTSPQIDYYIWEKSQSPKYKNLPRHKTKTFFY